MNRGWAAYSRISSTVSTSLSDGAWRTIMRDPICYQYFLLTVDMGGDVRYSMHNRIPLVDLAFHRGGTKLG
jgi:hypothetical protein